MLIIQISDMHVKVPGDLYKGKVDTHAHTARAVKHILEFATRPDAVLATGDLVDAGSAAEYAALRDLLAPLDMPVYLIPGNHDDRAALRHAFAGNGHAYLPPGSGPLCYAVEDHPVRIVALDSLIPGAVGGRLGADQIDWLEATLAARPEAPTIVMLHHPPAHPGVPWLDRIGVEDAAALGAVIGRHCQILRVLSGHDHRPVQRLWHGTLSVTAPSTAHQFVLTFEETPGGHWIAEPPACLVHRWLGPAEGMVTHTSYIGDYGEAHPLR